MKETVTVQLRLIEIEVGLKAWENIFVMVFGVCREESTKSIMQ